MAKWKYTDYGIKEKIRMISVDDIEPTEHIQDEEKIENFKKSGEIIKPVRVRNKYFPGQKYQLYDGHHRLAAAKLRGDKFIPAIISENVAIKRIRRKREGFKI
jgi:ParB-like chromosome segregation protein Spo0J